MRFLKLVQTLTPPIARPISKLIDLMVGTWHTSFCCANVDQWRLHTDLIVAAESSIITRRVRSQILHDAACSINLQYTRSGMYITVIISGRRIRDLLDMNLMSCTDNSLPFLMMDLPF
jgi:hypothetical protein